MITIEVRNLFKKIFGKDKPAQNYYKLYETLSTMNPNFVPFDGNIFNNDIVRSAVRPIANAVGRLQVKHIVGTGVDMKINTSKRIREVLKRPNPYMSMQDFLMKMIYQREMHHNAFAYCKRDEWGHVVEIYPLPYNDVHLKEVNGEVWCRFNFMAGKHITVPYEDLIHLRKDFYKDDFFGSGGTMSLQNIMEVIVNTDQSVVTAIKNSAIVKWIMKFKSVLRPEDSQKNIDEFIKNYLDIEKGKGVAPSNPAYDLEQVKDNNYVPNAAQMKEMIQRLYSYFGVNDNIVQNKYNEDEWLAFYEQAIEPIVIQLSEAFTRVFFTDRELGFGNKIVFEASNLSFASMDTKLRLVELLDRGIMNANEVRLVLNLPPVEGGNEYVRRLDTAPINDNNSKEVENDDNEGQAIP